jgi:hypothetical protein
MIEWFVNLPASLQIVVGLGILAAFLVTVNIVLTVLLKPE